MAPLQVFDLITQINDLSLLNNDLNSAERLNLFKKLSDLLKQNGKVALKEHEQLVLYLVNELHRTTSKDLVRKLIIRCINTVTRSRLLDDVLSVKPVVLEFLNNKKSSLGQKLFILNVYLDNLEQFGFLLISNIKNECLEKLTSWCTRSIEELKTASAPITISNLTQDLQLIFKSFVIFLQKCFPQTNENLQPDSMLVFERLKISIFDILQMKIFNMELGYAASMIYILLLSLESYQKLKKMIEEIFKSYTEKPTKIALKDLCFFQALLTMLKPQQFLNENLLDIFQEIIIFTLNSKTESTDVSHSIAVSRLVNFWTIKLIEIINLRDDALTNSLCEKENLWFNSLITFIWSHFDHNIDVVRNTSLQSYKLVLQSSKCLKKDKVDMFYNEEVKKCMILSWQSNSKLNALIILLDNGVSSKDLIKMNASIADEMIEAVSERSTACLVADLYSKLFKGHRDQIISNDTNDSLDEWSVIWWSPILRALSSKDKSKKAYIYEYVLPKVIRLFPDGVSYCQKMSSNYSTMISCTKVSRSLGINLNPVGSGNESNNFLYGNIDSKILKESLIDSDEQVRLDSLALICENPKTTEQILEIEFDLIKHFLYFNSDSLSPSYRQCVISSMKKLFFRLKESWTYHQRQTTKTKQKIDQQSDSSLKEDLAFFYKDFVNWLINFLFDTIHLDSSFSKRSQNLLLLTTFIDIIGTRFPNEENCDPLNSIFDYEKSLSRKSILSLIECLWDTYVNNKKLALELLFKINTQKFQKYNFCNKEYFNVAIKLLSSRKPIDSMTSVYLIMYLQKKSVLNDLTDEYLHIDLTSESTSLSLFLVESIVLEFEKHCNLAKRNLLLAALQCPIYGPLSAIRCIITQSVEEIKNSSLISKWTKLINKLIELCFDVSVVASSIVNSTSPEGLFPIELVSMQPNIIESEYVKSVTPQMLLVCCWRTMKEISLFYGDLVRFLPFEHEFSSQFILSSAQVFRIGDYFVRHLFETRHRGAFELAYVGFTSVCETFWKCKSSVYNEQPNKWLEHILNLIQSEEARYKLCSTRRGGGIPFFFQAIVSTELTENGRKALDHSMNILLKLAEQTYDDDNSNFTKCISMYVAAALFKDTRLGEDVLKYAESALIISISGFDSVFWNVRNASTLLFSSLITRIFGVSRSREEISRKNSLPGRMFFLRFPRLFDFFTKVINESIDSINTNLNAKLYLVVLILCHLFTLSDEISDPEALLHSYVPLLLKCCKSPVMKSRIFISKSIATITNLDRYPSLFKEIFQKHLQSEISSRKSQPCDRNYLNGIFQVLTCLIEKHNIFQYISFDDFILNLKPFIDLDHCATNYMCLLNLFLKIVYNQFNVLNHKKLTEELSILNTRAISSLLKATFKDKPVLLRPGTQDLLLSIGEVYFILIDEKKQSNLFKDLIESNTEYSTYLMRGVLNYLEQKKDNKLDNNSIELALTLFKPHIYDSILNWKIYKYCLNLRNSCDLFSTFLCLIKTKINNNKMDIFGLDNSNWLNLWKTLIDCGIHQTETETRISVLNLINQMFNHVLNITTFEGICFKDLLMLLESYMDRSEEINCLSQLFFDNLNIFKPSNQLFDGRQIQFWNIQMQILIQSDQDSNKIAFEIIRHLKLDSLKKSCEKYEYDSIPINKIALELFISMFAEKYEFETIRFLIEQFELACSEFDSNNLNNNEEELETVFDRGVESVKNSYFYYLNDLCDSLNSLLLNVKNPNIFEYLNTKYKLIVETLNTEFKEAFEKLNKMFFNDIRYAKMASCLKALKTMNPYVDQENKLAYECLYIKMKENKSLLNCFIQAYLI